LAESCLACLPGCLQTGRSIETLPMLYLGRLPFTSLFNLIEMKQSFFFFSCHKKKKKQKEKSPLFDNLLKSTGHLSHATTSRSHQITITEINQTSSLYGSLTANPSPINSFDFNSNSQKAEKRK
jgi:hypothetical protein